MNETNPKHGASGFTLIELILVLVLIGIIAGLTTPFVLSTLERMELRSGARQIAATLRYARSEAITLKTVFSFNADTETGRYWLTDEALTRSSVNQSLKPGLRLAHRAADSSRIEDGLFSIRFYPGGNSSGGSVRIEKTTGKNADTFYEIDIDPITGSSRIVQKER